MTEVIFNKKDGWEEIPDLDDFWCPINKGESNQGIYIEKQVDVGVNFATVYNFKNEDGLFKVFGTVGLDQKMDNIKIGEEVGLIYKGEKPSKPPKKPFKLWKVFHRKVGKKDTTEPEGSKNSDGFFGDEDAYKWVDTITKDLLEEGIEPTERKILEKAKEYHIEKVEGLTANMLGKIEKELKRKG